MGARAPAQAAGAGQERMTPPVCLPLLLLLLWSRRGATFRRVCVWACLPLSVLLAYAIYYMGGLGIAARARRGERATYRIELYNRGQLWDPWRV